MLRGCSSAVTFLRFWRCSRSSVVCSRPKTTTEAAVLSARSLAAPFGGENTAALGSLQMEKQALLRALQVENEPQSGRGVVVPGCPACRKRFNTSHQFVDQAANAYLEVEYLPEHNGRFAREAARPETTTCGRQARRGCEKFFD
jgi:hypothetical protein